MNIFATIQNAILKDDEDHQHRLVENQHPYTDAHITAVWKLSRNNIWIIQVPVDNQKYPVWSYTNQLDQTFPTQSLAIQSAYVRAYGEQEAAALFGSH